MKIQGFKLLARIVVLMFVAGGVAQAGTKTFKGSYSGTGVDVPVDIDSDSCFTAQNGATVCTDTSAYDNFGGMISPGGSFTGQVVEEFKFATGPNTGSCNIFGTMVPGLVSCTLAGSSEKGCELQAVTGNRKVERDTSSGDLLFFAYSSNTVCFDLSSGAPFNFAGSFDAKITGGTGKNTGASGVETGTYHGQEFDLDPAGHGFTWFETSVTGTITTP